LSLDGTFYVRIFEAVWMLCATGMYNRARQLRYVTELVTGTLRNVTPDFINFRWLESFVHNAVSVGVLVFCKTEQFYGLLLGPYAIYACLGRLKYILIILH